MLKGKFLFYFKNEDELGEVNAIDLRQAEQIEEIRDERAKARCSMRAIAKLNGLQSIRESKALPPVPTNGTLPSQQTPTSFFVLTPNRKYLLKCDNTEQMSKWILAIRGTRVRGMGASLPLHFHCRRCLASRWSW